MVIKRTWQAGQNCGCMDVQFKVKVYVQSSSTIANALLLRMVSEASPEVNFDESHVLPREKNAVISNDLLEYYESLIHYQGQAPEENPHLREYVAELRGNWESRVILRELRNRAAIPTCSGEVDCLENPTSRCMRGEHPTCSHHTDSCYLCIPRAS